MKTIKFNVDEVLPQLGMASQVINPKSSLPILSNIRLEAIGTKLLIVGSDGETWLQVLAPVTETDENVAICIEAKSIVQALRNLTGKSVTMEIDEEKGNITCNYENGHFSLPSFPATEYPMPISVDAMVSDTEHEAYQKIVDAQTLLVSIERASFATANDELRPVMNGVHFDFYADGMVTVASDGHKLAKYKNLAVTRDDNVAVIYNFTLSSKPSHILLNALSSISGDVRLIFNDRMVMAVCDTLKLTARLIEGRYPNYDSVIPKDCNKDVVVSKQAFVSALKRVLPMGSNSSELVVLNFSHDAVEISAEDIDFSTSAKESVACLCNFSDFTIGFKGSTLLQIIQNVVGDNVKMLFKEANNAGVVMDETTDGSYEYTSLIMPMLVS